MTEYSELLRGLLSQARATRQRRVLVLAGDRAWCRDTARAVLVELALPSALWISDGELPGAEVLAGAQVKMLLGQERAVVVFDAHAGFDPDAFGAVSGIIPGGGVLLLLCPPLTEWARVPDPASERIATWPHEIADLDGRFIQRLAGILQQAAGVTILRQGEPAPAVAAVAADTPPALFSSEDQELALEAIEQVVHGHAHRPLVLVSDRGRGKSSALGIAAAHLMLAARRPLRILVTAPRPEAVHALFAHAQRLLPQAAVSTDYLDYKASTLEFYAPDVLCLGGLEGDLLLVDEAAAIPAGMLRQLLGRYARIVFATTVHGYEGTGRGFTVRFRRVLSAQAPGWRELTLSAPIRWVEHDPLEQLVFRALLLDAEAAADENVQDAFASSVRFEQIERDALLADERTLSQLFGLLVVAHYRTTPNDLRNLLDGPDLSVFVARYQGEVVGTALVAREGGFDAALADEIYAGRRRPRGHLLAQSLITHIGLREAAALRCARIMRIAVHPLLQRQGVGTALLDVVREAVTRTGADVLGASFGATAELLRFWTRGGLPPVRVGFQRDHASGEHSVLVAQALTASGESVLQLARARFARDLPHWLADPLRELDDELAVMLLSAQPAPETPAAETLVAEKHVAETLATEDALTNADLETLRVFAHGQRSYEDALGPLWRLCVQVLEHGAGALTEAERELLIGKVLQRHTWGETVERSGLCGRAEVLAALRQAVAGVLPTVSATRA
jgi:tRNA(Met) cytidine acetyltransferase